MLELQSLEDVRAASSLLDVPSCDELECKICYSVYNLEGCRPKALDCCHRLCSKCFAKILDLGESPPDTLVCPFCRHVTRFPGEAVRDTPDDCNLVERLALQSRNRRNPLRRQDSAPELLLSPRHLDSLLGANPSTTLPGPTARSSPNYVFITIMEPPPAPVSAHSVPVSTCTLTQDSSSLDSLAPVSQRWSVWNCTALLCRTSARVLVWVLGLLYFSSLPMGVYLLIMDWTPVGVLLLSLVPASLVLILAYGFCQCICYELWRCWPP